MFSSVPSAPGHLPPSCPLLRRCRWNAPLLLALLCGTSLVAQNQQGTFGPATPRGRILSQKLELEAPEDACIAYLKTFTERRWTVRTLSREAFLVDLAAMGFSPATRQALGAPEHWQRTDEPQRFEITPPTALLLSLPANERAVLYQVLAQWQANKVERWPLVFRDAAAIARLADPDGTALPAAAVQLVDDLSLRFAGGLAFSDFSVLAECFPDQALLLRFLRASSTVETVLPRLSVHDATSVTDTLAYWTANHHNPFSEPMLVALLDARTERGVELASLLPGSARALSYDLDPAEVSYDTAINSFVISANIAAPPHPATDLAAFFGWFHVRFKPTTDEPRFGDVLVLNANDHTVLDYAGVFVADDLVFAKDPVGLGLWRFLRVPELLERNPHFVDGRFLRLRYHPPTT
jgi:hypothetical protein